jgi:hypothetical protein
MKHRWIRVLSAVGWLLLGLMAGWLFPKPKLYALEQIAQSARPYRVVRTTVLFHRLCTELLPTTPLGQHYLDLGYTYWDELGTLIWYDEAMAEQTWRVIDLYSPAVEALLDGEGATYRVSQEMVDELLRFLEGMENRATPELRRVIQDERARVPWDDLAGLTVEEAWAKLQEAASE